MKQRCPPGVICVDNLTVIFIGFFLCVSLYVTYTQLNNATPKTNNNSLAETDVLVISPNMPNYPYNNMGSSNVYGNPLAPPLKDDRYRVNIDTNAINAEYRQIGILTPTNSTSIDIMPLMGRPRYSSRGKWQYYTMNSAMKGGIKLPLSVNGKSATGEYGVDEVSNGDTMYAEGYNEALRVTVYDNDTIRYI